MSKIIKKSLQKIFSVFEKWPIASLVILLISFTALLFFGKKGVIKPEGLKEEIILKKVKIYNFNEPRFEAQATIDKTGYLKIVAQTSGVVNRLYVKEGDQVKKNQRIVYLSSNYQGGNAKSLQRQKAQKAYQFEKDHLDDNKHLIILQKALVEEKNNNEDEVKKIKQNSLNDTNSLLEFNLEILTKIDESLKKLKDSNISHSNDSAISQLELQKSQVWSGVNQLRSGKYTLDYELEKDTPIEKLSDLNKDLALKQLSLQEKALDLKLEVSKINYNLTQIAESLSVPVTPFSGQVEKVFVKKGQVVAPGQTLALISASDNESSLIVSLPKNLSGKINFTKAGNLKFNEEKIAVIPTFKSSDVVNNNLYSFYYQIPEIYQDKFSFNQVLTIDLPLVSDEQTILAPIDAIYQTQNNSFVYLTASNEGKLIAQTRDVVLGEVLGNLVEIKEGLNQSDQLILNRNIVDNDLIEIIKQ
jgi:multidrug efflux pump subunit AcrA (membrane-fusion protein)